MLLRPRVTESLRAPDPEQPQLQRDRNYALCEHAHGCDFDCIYHESESESCVVGVRNANAIGCESLVDGDCCGDDDDCDSGFDGDHPCCCFWNLCSLLMLLTMMMVCQRVVHLFSLLRSLPRRVVWHPQQMQQRISTLFCCRDVMSGRTLMIGDESVIVSEIDDVRVFSVSGMNRGGEERSGENDEGKYCDCDCDDCCDGQCEQVQVPQQRQMLLRAHPIHRLAEGSGTRKDDPFGFKFKQHCREQYNTNNNTDSNNSRIKSTTCTLTTTQLSHTYHPLGISNCSVG